MISMEQSAWVLGKRGGPMWRPRGKRTPGSPRWPCQRGQRKGEGQATQALGCLCKDVLPQSETHCGLRCDITQGDHAPHPQRTWVCLTPAHCRHTPSMRHWLSGNLVSGQSLTHLSLCQPHLSRAPAGPFLLFSNPASPQDPVWRTPQGDGSSSVPGSWPAEGGTVTVGWSK